MKFLLFLLPAVALVAAELPVLDRPIPPLRLEKMPLGTALRVLARAAGTTVLAEPGLTAEVTLDLPGMTLRSALAGITAPNDLYFEETPAGFVVRRLRTVLYTIDYPQLTRSGSGSASVTLGGANGTQGNAGGGLQSGRIGLQDSFGSAADATQISISQENPNTFWTTLEAELRAMLREDDGLVLNKFSGVAQVTAPMSRHATVRAYLGLVNRRITQQVEIEARLVEVTLRDEQKLGVDWELATGPWGNGTVSAGSPVEIPGVGGTVFASNTFAANLGFGRASAVIHALKQQGEVRTVAQPRLRTLNNQSAFVKVGEDRPFFRLQQSTSFSQGGTTVPVNQTQEQFSVSTITIGTILAVTPQIDSEGMITLDVLPAITRLQAIVTSPDGRQTAPLTDVKQASTIVRLRDGETAVIGGLISEDTGETTRGMPVLGSVPGVGVAFRSRGKLRHRTELVIFLTPRLVR